MSCIDCFKDCTPTSDQCVKYTGEGNTLLDIEFGDSLKCVEDALISYVTSLASGKGITLSEVTACTFLSSYIGTDKTLSHLLQAYSDAICSLKDSVVALQPASTSFDVSCLTGLTASSTQAQILQAVIDKACSIDTRVAAIEANYVTTSSVNTYIQSYLASSGSPTQEYTRMPKYVALDYHGPLTVFDASGKGLASQGYDKVYLCIGQTVNGFTLPSYQGRSSMMINTGLPGSLDSAIDPAQAANAGYGLSLNQKKGAYTHTLSIQEEVPHIHSVSETPHSHYVVSNIASGTKVPSSTDYVAWSSNKANGNQDYDLCKTSNTANIGKTSAASSNISVESAGGGQPHNNLSPVVGCLKIMYIP